MRRSDVGRLRWHTYRGRGCTGEPKYEKEQQASDLASDGGENSVLPSLDDDIGAESQEESNQVFNKRNSLFLRTCIRTKPC
jgi:hypothetical protein